MYWEQYDENVYWCLGVKAGCLAQTRDWTITRLNETLLLSLGILKLSLTSQKNLLPRTSPFVAMYARLGQTTLLVFIIFLCSGDSNIHLIQVGSQFTTGINFFSPMSEGHFLSEKHPHDAHPRLSHHFRRFF